MNLESGPYPLLLLILLSCIFPVSPCAKEDDAGLVVATGRPISLADVNSSMPIEYSRQSDKVIVDLRYVASSPVNIQIFGDGTVHGERTHSTSVRADNGIYKLVDVKHTFTAKLSEQLMHGMLNSMGSLLSFDPSVVQKELSESVDCWFYCPDAIISDGPGITTELKINILKYTLQSGETVENVNKIIKWDKTDVFETAAKFPQVYNLQELKGAIEVLLEFCDCVPEHVN